jgi:hypothetical protein
VFSTLLRWFGLRFSVAIVAIITDANAAGVNENLAPIADACALAESWFPSPTCVTANCLLV